MSLFALIKAVPLVVTAVHSAVEVCEWAVDKYDEYMGDDQPAAKSEQAKPLRKKSDTTRLTQYQYDFILHARNEWNEFNRNADPGERKNLQDLTAGINDKLNLDKSSSAYNRVWNGSLKRESLPTGKQLSFEFGENT